MGTVNNTYPVHVIADDREVRSGVIDAFQSMENVEVEIHHLSVGDYEIDHRLLFERKTLLDLVAAIKDGRLFRQAYHLASSPMQGAVILEGTSSDLRSSGMRREAIQGALITISLRFGIPILRSKEPRESARLMLYAANQIRTEGKDPQLRKGKRPKGKQKRQLYLLQGLPGIGPKKAQQLVNHFGTVEAVVTAEPEELMTVFGIGNRTAKDIYHTVREKNARYIL